VRGVALCDGVGQRRPKRDLYALNGIEQQKAQLAVKYITLKDFAELYGFTKFVTVATNTTPLER